MANKQIYAVVEAIVGAARHDSQYDPQRGVDAILGLDSLDVRLTKDSLPSEDHDAFGVLEYQIAKIMDQIIVEDVPDTVYYIDDQADPTDDIRGHKFMTNSSTIYKLPSGAYVAVGWALVEVTEEEAQAVFDEEM